MFDYTAQSLRRGGEPWFPVMGEFHYSRFRPELWAEELYKIKAGGVSIVSVYVIWIHHEEERGRFDFTGCRDLRRFLQAAQQVGIEVFLRLGPWVHGEVRNGGFPDWLVELGKTVRLRSNDPAYLACVRAYWEQAAAQAAGLLWADGGPVIGVQIENEYGHVGGLHGPEGEAHMRTLAAMARQLGFGAPLYTATGWGGACTGGLLPVMGGYCEAPWEQSVRELPANPNYLFSHTRNDALIASDHGVEERVTFDESRFPYLTAELGGGLQVTAHRRPVATGADIGAMSLAKLGSGVALLGYYMYHGGSNPAGRLSTLQESRATGYANDLPEINYDFNAPIRQYGTISDTYREIRLLALFLQDFGGDLSPLPAEIEPEGLKPEDPHTLRLAWRHDAAHGYLFVNNYQRRRAMDAHPGTVLTGRCGDPVRFPAIDIAPGEYFFFPYRMQLGGAVLESALATPLCRLQGERTAYVFYGDRDPQFAWSGGRRAEVLHLSRAQALHAAKICLDREYLVLTEDFVWVQGGRLVVQGGAETTLKTWPALKTPPPGFRPAGQEGVFTVYRRSLPAADAAVRLTLQSETADTAAYDLAFTYPKAECLDQLLTLSFAGERLELFEGGKKINDYFYTGQKALLSLRYFDFPKKLTAVVHALHRGDEAKIFLETWPALQNDRACRLEAAELRAIFR